MISIVVVVSWTHVVIAVVNFIIMLTKTRELYINVKYSYKCLYVHVGVAYNPSLCY